MSEHLRPYRLQVALGVLAAAACAGATVYYVTLVGPLLKAVLASSAGFTEGGGVSIRQLALGVVGVALIKATGQLLYSGTMQSVSQRVMADLRRRVYGRLLALPPSFYARRHTGELVSSFSTEASQVEYTLSQALAAYVRDVLQLVGLVTLCARQDLRLFALAFVVIPGTAIPVSLFARRVKRLAKRSHGSLGALTQLASEQLQNLAVVQAYGGTAQGLRRFDEEQASYLRTMRRSLFARGAFTPTLELFGVLGVALVIGFGARAVQVDPGLTEKLVAFLAAALLMYQPLKSLSGTFSLSMQGLAAAERLFALVDEPVPPPPHRAAGPLQRALTVEALEVRYGEVQALRGLSLQVRGGERVALVGPSGAGKSTLFSVLLGHTPYQSGSVRWDGEALSALHPATVRAQLAWVAQEPVLFSGTVRQNLLLGRPEASELELWKALEQANASGFVRALPHGLDEPVGERGSRLSGGQRQRVAIARAFLRRPSLLLLDEPTSALDAESEREVQAGLSALMEGRTTLVIAHRLSTVRGADRICVLEEGALVEEGTHDALVARGGRYAALLRAGEMAA